MQRREFIGLVGGVAVWAVAGRAQPLGKIPRLAIVNLAVPTALISQNGSSLYRAFFGELRRLGFAEDRNIIIERWSAEGEAERYPELARQVVASKPDVIFASSARFLTMLKGETLEIPIVAITSDPVGSGLAYSLAQPGGNITGVTTDAGLEILGKHLELLKEISPNMRRVSVLAPRGLWSSPYWDALQMCAKQLAISVIPLAIEGVIKESGYRTFFDSAEGAQSDAILVPDIPENTSNRQLIVELANRHHLPTLYPHAEYTKIGGLMSYGYDISDLYRRATGYVDAIIKGAKAGDLPFYQPTRLYLIVNSKTAAASGINIPQGVLARADHVIE